MKPDKAPAYWPTRILLAVAIISTALVVVGALWSALWGPWMAGGRSSLWGLPSNVVTLVPAVAIPVIGLIWTIRIFRGPRDEPPKWRYRDR